MTINNSQQPQRDILSKQPETTNLVLDVVAEIERESKLYHVRMAELSALILQAGRELEERRCYYRLSDETEMDERIRELARIVPPIFRNNYKFRHGGLSVCKPLKAMCILRASTKTIKAVYEAYPDAIMKDHHPHLDPPIHWACHVRLQRKAIEFLLVKYPDSLLKKATFGKTPLHIACGADVSVARCLLHVCPQAAMETDDFDNTPLHLSLLKMKDRVGDNDDDKDFARLIVDLTKAAPMAASMKFRKVLVAGTSLGGGGLSGDGDSIVLPLHVALEYIPPNNTATIFTSVIRELLLAYPEAAQKEEIVLMGWKRKHLWERRLLLVAHHLSHAAGLPLAYSELYPLHAIVQCRLIHFDANMLKESFEYFHHRLVHFDSIFVCLPFHLLLSRIKKTQMSASTKMVSMLLESALYVVERKPRAAGLHFRDPSTGFFPFMMVATIKLDPKVSSDDEDDDNDKLIYKNRINLQLLELIYQMLRLDYGPQQALLVAASAVR